MLYHLHELHHAILAPYRTAASIGKYLLSDPWNPWSYTPGGKALAAGFEIFERATRYYGKPKFGIGEITVLGQPVPVTEQTVHRLPFCQLKHFRRDMTSLPCRRQSPKVLIVAPLSGHYATLLRDTVKTMLERHDVYIADWRDARKVPLHRGRFDLDDYIDYILWFLQLLGPGAHVMAVCQPGPAVLAATALMAQTDHHCQPASVTLMGSPIDARKSPTAPNDLATRRSLDWFARHAITRVPFPHAGCMRCVYPGFLQLTGFMTLNLERHWDAHKKLFHHLVRGDGDSVAAHREFYDEYLAVMDLPAEYYLQTIQVVFQEHRLARGIMMHRDRPIDPGAIRKTSLMTVEGENDDISGIGQTQAAHDLCRNIPDDRRFDYVQPGVGHYGVFNGSRWRNEIAPRIRDFIHGNHALAS